MTAPTPGRLRPLLAAHGLRLVDLAAAADVSIETIRRVDRADLEGLSLGKLAEIALALGVPATRLVPELAADPGPGLLAHASEGRARAARLARDRRLLGKSRTRRGRP